MKYEQLGNSDLNVSRMAGVMAQNKRVNAGEKHAWSARNQKI